ncbi:MAG: WecB/TagA/CpsF family glycosyltransferase [Eubacteriales bacterium]|nr:WecB/TagA/CpsF family glycosyltransferase [Eubacteriales bacterium]
MVLTGMIWILLPNKADRLAEKKTGESDMGMREYASKKVNVLGIDVSVMRPEKAVNLTMEYMRKQGLETIFFLSAEASLFCQNQPWAAELVRGCRLVLTGDKTTELAVSHRHSEGESADGIGKFADEYLKRLFWKLNREGREIYAVVEKQEHFDTFREYMESSYPDIVLQGIVYEGKTKGEPDKVVNEINGNIPDIVFFCLPVEQQLLFVKEYSSMMNTRLCICIESLWSLIRKETVEVPSILRLLHLDSIWYEMGREPTLRKVIAGSIFKKRVMGDVAQAPEKEEKTEREEDFPEE